MARLWSGLPCTLPQVKIDIDIENVEGRYNVLVSTLGFTASEEEKLAQFGEPLVEVGGEFTGSATRPGDDEPVEVEFELPQYLRRLRSDFPVRRVFDLADTENADIQAKVWATTMTDRLTSAKNELMAQVAPFVGQTRTTV